MTLCDRIIDHMAGDTLELCDGFSIHTYTQPLIFVLSSVHDICYVCVVVPGERLKYRMEPGFGVATACPLRMVLGSNHAGGSRGEARRTGRWDVSGTRQFRRSLSAEPELPVVRPNAAHAHRALPGHVQPVLAVWVRRLPVHRGADRAFGRRLEDRSILLLASACPRLAFISRASDARRVKVCAGPDAAVSVSVYHSPAYPGRPHPAPPSTDLHQRLARGTTILVADVPIMPTLDHSLEYDK